MQLNSFSPCLLNAIILKFKQCLLEEFYYIFVVLKKMHEDSECDEKGHKKENYLLLDYLQYFHFRVSQ